MSLSFTFVPRKVVKAKKDDAGPSTRPIAVSRPAPEALPTVAKKSLGPDDKKGLYTDADLVSTVSLALSDYALWLDPDLYLLGTLDLPQGAVTEASAARSLRAQSDSPFDVRLVLAAPVWSNWTSQVQQEENGGMYEVRRKDWETALSQSNTYTKDYWDQRTVYLENIPMQYKHIPGMHRFAAGLLSGSPSSIQAITLPPHHLDKPEDKPKPRGFAFAVLQTLDDVESSLKAWPWERSSASPSSTDLAQEATTFGFRTLSKSRWENLKEEYLTYRAELVEEVVQAQDLERRAHSAIIPQPAPSPRAAGPPQPISSSSAPPQPQSMSLSSTFPSNCLVFARNVHPETNKTTLKALFGQAFPGDDNGMDYIDFSKGLDTCHLRLAAPRYANVLVEYFAKHLLRQSSGLDKTGTPTTNSPLSLELVPNMPEELYWSKVPEKVRREAVAKAVRLTNGNATKNDAEAEEGNGRKRRRKR
ncbi:hypothetical protein C8J56DRAFT_936570 [Mycena floridula]|nr:hypothetical protein C8J56DRAFT_936570 [Mycena floridula]